MPIHKILVVEDESEMLQLYRGYLEDLERDNPGHIFQRTEVRTPQELRQALEHGQFDLAILDYELKGGYPTDVLKDFVPLQPRVRRIIGISGKLPPQDAAFLLDLGVQDWLPKIAVDNQLPVLVEDSLALPSRFRLTSFYSTPIASELDRLEAAFVGSSEFAKRVRMQICEAALSDSTVLITGPSGSGKEVVARLIHDLSRPGRAGISWIALNCAALSEGVLEAELFGVAKGAATGVAERDGYLQAVRDSTLFLDEVGHAGLRVQTALLRAIETKEAIRVGSTQSYGVRGVRFIAATATDPGLTPMDDAFLYRLSGIHIKLLSLNDPERKGDIELLAANFARLEDEALVAAAASHEDREFRYRDFRNNAAFSPGARRALVSAQWPGNARELRHALRYLIQKARYSKSTITEPMVTSFLLERPSQATQRSGWLHPRKYDDLLEEKGTLRHWTRVLQRELVREVHERVANDERTNEAYKRTADYLGCGVTVVKELLRVRP